MKTYITRRFSHVSQSCGENYPDAIARRDVPVLSGAERERGGALLYIYIYRYNNIRERVGTTISPSRYVARALSSAQRRRRELSPSSPLFWSSHSLEIGPGIIQCDPWTRTRSRLARNIIHHRFSPCTAAAHDGCRFVVFDQKDELLGTAATTITR